MIASLNLALTQAILIVFWLGLGDYADRHAESHMLPHSLWQLDTNLD